jgi:predicted lipoprotein with Yx(FWY)xxD motif
MTTALTRSALVFSAFLFSAVGAQAAVLAAQNGMTLYIFDQDKGDQSVCYDDCAVNWPPYVGNAADKMPDDLKLVQRTDSAMQWTYDGKPVYFFKGDATADGKPIGIRQETLPTPDICFWPLGEMST